MISCEPWQLPLHAAPLPGGARTPGGRDGWPSGSGRPGKVRLPFGGGAPPLHSVALLRCGVLPRARKSKDPLVWRVPNQ